MDTLPALALVLGALGSLLAVYATIRGQKSQSQENQLTLAWEMQEKRMDDLVAENQDLRDRATNAEKQIGILTEELFKCKEFRRQLEVQVELLKLRLQNG